MMSWVEIKAFTAIDHDANLGLNWLHAYPDNGMMGKIFQNRMRFDDEVRKPLELRHRFLERIPIRWNRIGAFCLVAFSSTNRYPLPRKML
ncbi:MAG: hypothetical protein H6875_06225 [Hyphomicrobiaceae bacterium]|nr:hypothetical protein [Hyphomicrobiaceae bacterium]